MLRTECRVGVTQGGVRGAAMAVQRTASVVPRGRGVAPSSRGVVLKGSIPPRAKPKIQKSLSEVHRPLSEIQAEGAKIIEKYQDRLVTKARGIMDAALRAQETKKDKDTLPPKGFASWHDFRVAKDALKPKRESPVYLEMAQRTVEADAKLKALRTERAPLNLQVMTYVQGAPPEAAMKVIEVKA